MKPKLFFLIFSPSIIYFLVMYILDKKDLLSTPIYLMPLFFGILIGLFNYKCYRHKVYINKPIQVVLLSVIISYLCFVFALLTYLFAVNIINYLFEILSVNLGKESISRLAMFFTMSLVTPISLLFSFKWIFEHSKGKISKLIIIIFLFMFSLFGYLFYYKSILSYEFSLLWLPLVILSIQLIIYQDELKDIISSKKSN